MRIVAIVCGAIIVLVCMTLNPLTALVISHFLFGIITFVIWTEIGSPFLKKEALPKEGAFVLFFILGFVALAAIIIFPGKKKIKEEK